MATRRNVFYQQQKFLGYELERYAILAGWQQVNVRINGRLLRSFLSMEPAKRWCEGMTKAYAVEELVRYNRWFK